MKKLAKKMANLIMKPEMAILPGQLAFFVILALFPLLTIFGMIGGNIPVVYNGVISIINNFVPKSISKILLPFITDSKITGNLFILLIIGFYMVSNAANAIIITTDQVFHIKFEKWITRRIKAFLMVIILIILFLFNIIVLGYGNVIIKNLIKLEAVKGLSDELLQAYALLKWPLALIIIFLMVKLIYSMAPDAHIDSKYMNRGALFTTVIWVTVSFIYSIYVSKFANYKVFYGSISAIIIMMMWLYFLSYVFSLGIEINANYYNKHKR